MAPKQQKKPDPSEPVQINLRAPALLIEKLDKWAESLNAKGHARWTRNAIILAACERALEERGTKGEAP